MAIYNGSGLTQGATANCFIHLVGGMPKYLIGVIHRQDTGQRPGPPGCQGGFETAGTPFARGHIMALELGGCDQSQNIVAQYGLWQGNGAWRQMETDVRTGGAEVMIVEIDYQGADGGYAAQKQRFAAGEKLFHWTDRRIPSRFRVWTRQQSWSPASGSLQDYLGADDTGKEARIAALITAIHGVGTVFDATIAAMPDIDREYWKAQMVRRVALLLHEEYGEAARAAREQAVLALAAAAGGGGGGGTMRRASARQAVKRASASPYAAPLPEVPASFAVWSARSTAKDAIIAAVRANTDHASEGWTDAERLALTRAGVTQALAGG